VTTTRQTTQYVYSGPVDAPTDLAATEGASTTPSVVLASASASPTVVPVVSPSTAAARRNRTIGSVSVTSLLGTAALGGGLLGLAGALGLWATRHRRREG
jgi:hypothetical protein